MYLSTHPLTQTYAEVLKCKNSEKEMWVGKWAD